MLRKWKRFYFLMKSVRNAVNLKDKNVLNAIFATTEAAMYIQQARRQEMKWGGVFFCKKKWKWGVFYKRSGKWGCFCKKVDLSSTQGALCIVSVFFTLHFTYLGVRTHPTPPLPTGLYNVVCMLTCRRRGSRDGQSGVLTRGRVVLVPVWRSEQP